MPIIKNEHLKYILNSIKKQPSEKFESEQVEFKNYSSEKSLLGDNELVKEISAFANHKGGVIIVGVVDSSNIKNQKWEDQLNGFIAFDYIEIQERLKGKIEPKLDIIVEEFAHEEKYYTVIHVPKSYDKLIGTRSGKYCMRDGKSSVPMTSSEIEEKVKNLQNFDWTSDIIKDKNPIHLIDEQSIEEAINDYSQRRNLETSISKTKFLEAIGATRNGYLTRGGLLFLGKKDEILKHLGNYEYRFSRKSIGGQLILNNVWMDNLWNTIKISKTHFEHFNKEKILHYKDIDYHVTPLDESAFHEAYLNALVHRDYTQDGMTVVNYLDREIKIASPGLFYGGVNENNITFHEPRHRNKTLANILMKFQFIDRAGMGVLRMGVGSLKYGRSFPEFKEKEDSIEVIMQTEYFRAGIFLITTNFERDLSIPELLILNLVYEKGFVKIDQLEKKLSKIIKTPWEEIEKIILKEDMAKIIELCGDNEGVYLKVKEDYYAHMEIKRELKIPINSDKHVKLYKHLKSFGSESNSNLTNILGYSQSSSTSKFLKNAKYVDCAGEGRNRKWELKNSETASSLSQKPTIY